MMDLVRKLEHAAAIKTDTAFVKLLLAQWAVLVGIALWLPSPGGSSMGGSVHSHLLIAVFGGVVALQPFLLTRYMPGTWQTRHAMAIAQMLTASLLITSTRGRLESPLYVFASLAFLAFYLDWTVLLTGSAVVAADHVVRAISGPGPIFGAPGAGRWTLLQHAAWVVLTDTVLIWSAVERKRNLRAVAAQQIEHGALLDKAHTDVLTGLPNRLSFQRWMEEHLVERRVSRKPFALMYIDLDRFKEINDLLGHAAGDYVLREVARRLSAYIAPQSLLTRVGGDEFVAAFTHVPRREEFIEIAQEITTLLMLPFHYEGDQLHLGASIGISTFPEHGDTQEELLNNADRAMYRVKQQGRRGFHFCDTPEPLSAGARGEQALQYAIDNDHLELHFQPLVDLSTTITGFEALVRWRCPERGLIPPVEFIAAAEQSGQIVPLGRVVLTKAVQQAAAWLRQGLNFGHITVNVSPRQLLERDFVFQLESLLKEYGVPAAAICLECTESACASNAQVQSPLQELHACGIRIYVDDFGTGYSSLGRMQEMQFDVIKIDRCFIQRLTTSDTGSEIVSLMISFAHLLGMTVVAEGVETAQQFEVLQSLGCDHIQGYYIAKPMQTADATAFLIKHQGTDHSLTDQRVKTPRDEATAAALASRHPLFHAASVKAHRDKAPQGMPRPKTRRVAAVRPELEDKEPAPSRIRTAPPTASWADIFALRPTA